MKHILYISLAIIGANLFPLREIHGREQAINQSGSKCVVTGCSGHVCADREVITTCEYKEEYACYKDARCERQANGQCGWTQTPELKRCLETKKMPPPPTSEPKDMCFIGGCYEEICSHEAKEAIKSCNTYKPEYACYKSYSRCERQANGQCGWTQTPQLSQCLNKQISPYPTSKPPQPCFIGGCSGEICSDQEGVITDCQYKPEYMCYNKYGRCERQANGQCGWTQTPQLSQCLVNQNRPPWVPKWVYDIPIPAIRNLLEQLFTWVYYFNQKTDQEHLLQEQNNERSR